MVYSDRKLGRFGRKSGGVEPCECGQLLLHFDSIGACDMLVYSAAIEKLDTNKRINGVR